VLEVDYNGAIVVTEGEGLSEVQLLEVLRQMTEGHELFFRFQEWPSKFVREGLIPLYGFGQAWRVLKATYEKICLDGAG
jgi:hypothetical protein